MNEHPKYQLCTLDCDALGRAAFPLTDSWALPETPLEPVSEIKVKRKVLQQLMLGPRLLFDFIQQNGVLQSLATTI